MNRKTFYKYLILKNNLANEIRNEIKSESPQDKLLIKIYPKVNSIIANNNSVINNEYSIIENKLYQNDILVTGNFFIAISNNEYYVNKAWSVNNGELSLLENYFDNTNSKLILNSQEFKTNGTLILTDDFKLYIRINNIWTTH